MNNPSSESKGVVRGSNVALARCVAEQAAMLAVFARTPGNNERFCLMAAVAALQADPPRVSAALQEAEDGVAHAWRGTFEEDRMEARACAKVVALLRTS